MRFNFRAYSWHYLFLLLLVRWFFSFREHVWRRGVQCACSGAWKIGEQLRLFDSCRRRRSAEHCAPPSARAGRAARRGARLSRMTSPCGDGLRVAAQRGARWARRGCGPGAAPRRAQKEQARALAQAERQQPTWGARSRPSSPNQSRSTVSKFLFSFILRTCLGSFHA